jgi:predicted ABC-class ATPase
MRTGRQLDEILGRIDGCGYKAYKGIEGTYRFTQYQLSIEHVQGDPYAAPSRIHVQVEREASAFPTDTAAKRIRTVALCDFLTRRSP